MNTIIEQLKHYQILQSDTIPYFKKGNYKIFSITNRELLSMNLIRNYNHNYYYFIYTGDLSSRDLNTLVIQQSFNSLI